MLSSRLPIAAAPVSSSSSSSSSTVSALPPSSTAAISALNHSSNKDELACQVAHDCPSDFLQSSGSLLSNETVIKTMNLCVPEWDATGREMDMIWDPTELCSPSKGKCDSGQTRRPDLGFVPEHDFEELCWEDGQLIVMQGLSSKGNFKNRSYWQVSAGETAPLLLGRPPASGMDSTFDTMEMGTGELMDSSTVNMHAQDDELLSWLQHPCDELVDKLEIPSDAPPTSTAPSMGSERLCPGDFIHHGIRQNTTNAGETSSALALKSLRYDTVLPSQTTMLHRPDHEHGDVPQNIHMNALTGSSITPTIITPSKEQFEHGSMMVRLEMPPLQMHPVMAVNSGHSVLSGSTSSMNVSNFSRPAGAFKANFHSVGMASGPSGAERLKQLDRVAVDALKAESIDSTTKHLRLIAPKRDGVAPIAPNVSRSVGASVVHNRPQSFSLRREAKQGGSANGAVNGSSGMVDKSGDLNLSITSSAALGTDGSTEVAEPSYTSSSGGSEESDGVDVKQAAGVCKKKVNDEDSEIQSKSESTGTKKHATGGGKSMKGSRASKNHNQSERRRRDRISEKMKALQALVPNSYKTDKASMLEEAIAYVKALKAQIQMMSYRSGMYFSPMLIPQGMQHVQMAAWPHMGMGMGRGMGMGVGMGMHDMNMTSTTTRVSQFSPLASIPGAVMPAAHAAPSAALDSAWSMHVVPPPAHQIMVPTRPGNLAAGTCDSSPTPNVASHMLFPASQQQQPVQCTSPQIVVTGVHGNCMPYIQ